MFSLSVDIFRVHTQYISMEPLRSLVFLRYFLSMEFFRGPHLVHIWRNFWEVWSFIHFFKVWNFSEVHTWYIFDETLEKFGLSSQFPECQFFQRFTLGTFLTKPLRSLVFHRYFLNLEFFRGLYSVHFDETLVRFDLPSMFSECGIFQRSTLNTFLMKLLRSSDFHRCFLSVDIFRGSHLVYSDETLEEFGLSTISSECGIFQKSTLSTFLMKPLRSLFFHRYFLSVEFFRGSHLVHYWRNSWEVWSSVHIFQNILYETLEEFGLPSIFFKCGNSSEIHT